MNPNTVGSFVNELFSMFKKFSPALKYTSSDKSISALLLTSSTSKRPRLPLVHTSSIERIWLYETYNVRRLFSKRIVLGISFSLFPERSKCLSTGYLFKEWFFNEPNDDILLFFASIDSRVGIVPNEAGRNSITFLLIIRYFSWLRLLIYSLNYLIWLSDKFKPLRFFPYTKESISVNFIFLRINSPPWLNSFISLTQCYFSLDWFSNVEANFLSKTDCSSGAILSFKYFFKTLVPPFLMFCLIALSGFPSTCNLTKEFMKPISHGS